MCSGLLPLAIRIGWWQLRDEGAFQMAVWITKTLPFSEWGTTQFRMHLLQQEMGQPLHLAMLLHPGEIGSADVSSLCQIIR